MKMFSKKITFFGAAVGLLALGMASQVHAAGTTAGTPVTNTASVSYTVADEAQTPVTGEATFIVDRVIRMTLTNTDGTNPTTAPGADNKVTTYTLTNDSNAVVDFSLTAIDVPDEVTALLGSSGTDAELITVYIDDGDKVLGAGDAAITSADLVNLDEDETISLLVVVDVPVSAKDGNALGVLLSATATDSSGNPLTTTASPDIAIEDTVLGDGAGVVDTDQDGIFTVYGVYDVNSASISVTKTSELKSDPFNLDVNPEFYITDSIIEYCIVVENDGSTDADLVVVSDPIPNDTEFEAGTVKTGVGTTCDDTDSGDGSYSATPTPTVTADFGTLTGSSAAWVSFQVKLK